MGMHMNIRNTAVPALILAPLVSLGSAFAATPDAAADNPQCAKYGHTKGTRIGERQCGRCGEAWVTGAGIVERQTHDKLCYHFKKGVCKGWYCKNCHTYS